MKDPSLLGESVSHFPDDNNPASDQSAPEPSIQTSRHKGSQDAACRFLQAVLALRAKGFAPIPVPLGEKNPNRTGWQNERHSPDEIPRVFAGGVNVGLLCGAPSGGLYDVDCDTPEAAKAAPYFLPKTGMMHGRAGKPLSHYWYRCPETNEKTKQFPAPTEINTQGKKTTTQIVELRGTGGQTIVPPSIHPTKEPYQWVAAGEPATIVYADLLHDVQRTAACALLARAWPGEGNRDNAAMALSGALVRAGWSDMDIGHFVKTVARIAGDDEWERRDKAKGSRAAEKATGWPTLSELLLNGKHVVKKVRDWLGIRPESVFERNRARSETADAPDDSPNASDQPTMTLEQARESAADVMDRLKTDSGAIFEEESMNAMLVLDAQDHATYQRVLDVARRHHVPLRDLNKQLATRRRETANTTILVDSSRRYNEICAPGTDAHGIYYENRVQLTNFTARIQGERRVDDGVTVRSVWAIDVIDKTGRQSIIDVPAADYAPMAWVNKLAGANARVLPVRALRDHPQDAIKAISYPIPVETTYAHTGWREIAERWVYLHAGGGIGADGVAPGVKTDLPSQLVNFVLPAPPDGADLAAAIRASLDILNGLAPDDVVIPQYAAIWRAVIGDARVGEYSLGESAAKKSSLAAVFQQHFGAAMDYEHLPISWRSTANSIETVMFHAKDALVVIDEFKPEGSAVEKQRMRETFARIMRDHANGQGRNRLNARSELMPAHPSRCLPLATGEESVSGHSLTARILMVEVPSRDANNAVNLQRLTACQKNAKRGVYAQAMAGFVRWMAGKYAAIRQHQQDMAETLRDEARKPGMHDRTPTTIGELGAALEIFLGFAAESGAITDKQSQALWDRCWAALCATGAKQTRHQDQERPEIQIRRLLASLIATKSAHLASVQGGPPADATAWGWEIDGLPGYECSPVMVRMNSTRIGWVADDGLYLDPHAAYSAAAQLAQRQGESMHANRTTLPKRMYEHGLFVGTEFERRGEYTMRRKIEGAPGHRVWWVAANFISDQAEPEMNGDATDGETGDAPTSMSA